MDYEDDNTFASVAWDRDPAPDAAGQPSEDTNSQNEFADGGGVTSAPTASTSKPARTGEVTTEVIMSEKLEVG